MRVGVSIAVWLLGYMAVSMASLSPQWLSTEMSHEVTELFARAHAHLGGRRAVTAVASLDLMGTRTRSLETHPTEEPFQLRVLFPDSFQARVATVIHTYSRGVFWQRPAGDAETRRIAARTTQFRFMKTCLTYLASVPPAMRTTAEHVGLRDFGWVKGRTIAIRNPVERLRVDLVLDGRTARPLAIVTTGVVSKADGGSGENRTVALFKDYREVGGVRLPHRIEERSDADHAMTVLTRIVVNSVRLADFAEPAMAGARPGVR